MKVMVTLDEQRANALPTEPGPRERKTFLWAIDDKGDKYLKEDRVIDRQDEINSYLEETKIENIVKRAALNPELWANLAAGIKDDGTITDVTGLPRSLAEAQQLMLEINQKWEKLPVSTKEKFGNSCEKFIHMFGTIEWANAMGIVEKERGEVTVNELKQ